MIEYLPLVLTGLSISASIFYYAMVLRNAQKIRQRDQIYLRFQSFNMEYNRAWVDLLERDTLAPEEYINLDSETRAKYHYLTIRYNNVGLMLKEKMMDPELLFQIFSPRFIMRLWEFSKEVIYDNRTKNNFPTYMAAFEYLYNETKKRFPDIRTAGKV